MVGNFWNNWLGGVNNPLRYLEAAYIVGQKKGNVNFKDIFGHTWDNPKLLQKAQELGVMGRGQYGGDIERTLRQYIEGKGFKWGDLVTPTQRNIWMRGGFKVGKTIEDNARLAHFIDRLKKGDSAETAAMSVKKYLFDYGDMTDIE